MRAALLLGLVLAAGCLASPPSDNHATPPPTDAPEDTPATGGPGGSMLVRPAEESNASDDFRLLVTESASGLMPGGSVTFNASATNLGAPGMRAEEPPCRPGNPTFHLEDENGTTVATSEPQMSCMVATRLVAFPTNETVSREWTWDGRRWDGARSVPAEPGRYAFVVEFSASRDARATTLVVREPVNVLAPGSTGLL